MPARHAAAGNPFRFSLDYFEIFNLPPSRLALDPEFLKKTYYELSRKFHPDFFQHAGPEERQKATEKSALLNKAYNTLRDPFRRAEYVLEHEGVDVKKDLAPVAADLLAEVFEIQDNLSTYLEQQAEKGAAESELKAALDRERDTLRKRLHGLAGNLEKQFLEWDGSKSDRKALAEKMLHLLHEKKYIDSILKNVETGLKKK